MATTFTQLKELWNRLRPIQRTLVIGATLGVGVLMTVLIMYGTEAEYGALFADLKASDAQGVVEKLKAANVPYKLANNGTTISVPTSKVAEMRMQIAASGALTGGHVGFDLFDKTSFGATDFAQQVNYQRALEGELARTLEGMDELESARVHITQSKESIFAEKEQKAKASVMLRVRQGRELSRERTEAVVNLLSSAVEGLDPADVSVMDTRGRVLTSAEHGGSGGGDAGAFNSHLEAKRKLEAETAERIVSLLEPISGVGHVRADVATDVDFSQTEQTEEKYDPKSQVVRSQQTSEESRNSGGKAAGAIVGARSNDPSAQPGPAPAATPAAGQTQPAQTANAGVSGDQRVASTVNYEIDKIVKRTIGGGGRIARLSVSVVVDFKSVNGVMTTRTPDELKKMQDLVAAAVGVDAARGDQIVVQTIPFDQPTIEVANLTFIQKNRDLIPVAIKYSMLVVVALLLLLFVVRPAKRAILSAANAQFLPAMAGGPTLALPAASFAQMQSSAADLALGLNAQQMTPRTVAEIEREMQDELARETASGTPEAARAEALRKQITDRVSEDPEMVAKTIRSWLNDEK